MKNFLQVNRASLGAKKNFYLNLNQLPSKNDGGQSCDGNRQSRVMSQSGCGAVDVPMTSYGASDEHPMSIRSASDGRRWKNRGWKYVAMIFAVLVMSIANVGMAWGADATISPSESATASYYFAADGTAITAIAGSGGHDAAYNKGTPKFKLRGTTGKNVITFDFTIGTGITITSFKVNGTKGSNTNAALDGSSVTFGTALTGLSKTSSMSFTLTCTDGTSSSTNRETTISSFTLTYTTSGGGGGGGGDECSSPSFSTQPTSASYAVGASATNLTATATATNPGTITYKWQKSTNYGSTYSDIDGATNQTYKPSTSTAGITYYRSVASFSGGCSDTNSDPAIVAVSGGNSGTMSGSDYICFKNKTANNTATSATTSNSTALTSLSGQLTGDGSGNKTTKVTASTGQTYSFTVASGYTFDPTYIGFKGSYVGSGAPTQMTFTYALKNSSSETLCSGTFVQATHANTAPLDTIYKGSIDITPLEAGTYTLKITGSQDKNVANNFRLGNWVTIKGTVASSCSAPTAVYVTQTAGSSDMVAGESFTLSAATSTGVEDGATYQWYRGSTEVGTNSPIFTVASCTAADAGTYWCKITNPCSSDAHTTNTVGFGIKVWQVLLYKDSWNAYDLTSTGTKTGEVTRQLTPGTYYIKLTHNNGVDFGVNTGSTISEITATTPSAWTLYNGQNNIKVTVTTAGDYTFGVNYTSADNPTLSVTYPPSTISSCDKIYFCPTVNSIATGSAKFSIYFYNATTNAWANCYLVSGTEYADDAKYVAFAPSTATGWTGMIVVRYSSYISNWDNKWNQSEDITYNGYNYIVGRNEWTSDNPAKFKTHLNSFYSSTTPAMDESAYCVIVGGTTTASTNLPSSAVTYTSDNTSVATVGSSTGVITGVAAGTATITAKVGTCTVGTATVTVYAAPSVVLSSSSVTYGASAPTLTPSNFATITGYSSLTTGTATINSSGVISIAGAGTTTFTVTGTDQCGNSVNVTTGTFTVNKADISPSLSYTSTTLTYGGGNSSTPTISGNTGSGTVTYSVFASSPSGCATVNESTGVVTPVSAGAATITATIAATTNYNGGTATTNFTINKATPTKYDFSVDKTTLCGEETATLTLEDSEDGVTYELRSDATHSIADTQKAGTGSALAWTGLGAGNYVVYAVETANYEERQMNSSKITVTTGTATSITTQPTNQEVTVGEEATLTVVAAGTSLSYQWKESATESGEYSNVASGGTSASYSVTPAAAGTKWYKCVVTGTCGTETTAARKIVANAAVTYTVTYVYNGATGGDDTPSATGASVTLPEPTKEGYTLQGWYTSSGSLAGAATATYNPTSDITLYALWREDECAGGGGGSTTIFSISGMSWSAYSAENGTITIYPTGTPDETYTATLVGASTVSVVNTNTDGNDKAMLGKNSIKIGGNAVSMRFTLTSGTLQNGDVISFTNSGTNQLSFTTTATRNTTPATTSDTYTIEEGDGLAGSSSLYVWRSTSSSTEFTEFTITRAGGSGTCYYVTYNGNGADGGFTTDEASHASGSNVTVKTNSFTKTGYTFTGWNTDPDGEGGTAYTAGGTISSISGNMTLYAQWAEEVACSTDPTVTAGSNSAVTSTTATVTCASGISAFGDGCSISSYGFVLGTSANPTLSNTVYEVGTTYASTGVLFSQNLTGLTKNTTYYVRPYATNSHGTAYGTQTSFTTLATYTVTYNGNGATSGDAPVDASSPYDAGSNVTVLGNTGGLAKTNYTFDGWATANDGTGTSYAADGTISSIAANTTLYAKWKQTVTLKTGAQGSGSDQTPVVYLNGTSVSDFTAHTASGYTLQGYYTAGSGGTKVLNADGTFAAANVTDYITSSKWSRTGAAPTLYAQWVASEDCSTSDFVIRKGDATEYLGCMESSSYNGTATSFTAGSATTVGNAKMTISNYDGGIKRPGEGKTFSIVIEPVSGYYLKSICWAGKVEDDETVSYYWDDNSGSAITISPTTTSGTGVTYNAPSSTTKFTASYTDDGDGSGGIWWRNVQVEVCAAGGTTYSVTYDDNDATGGTAPTDDKDYSYGDAVTVEDNGTLAKTNYTFAGWTTNDDGTGSSYVADNTFSITANTTLYAKWTQPVTFDANTANHGSTGGLATAVWNATGLTGITHATPASGYKLLGYYTDATEGTKVLNSDGTFAETDVTDYITDGKWSRTSTTTLYAQYEVAGSLTWNLVVNSDTTSLTTSSKTSSFTEILNSNMTNAALEGGLTYAKGKKTSLTGKISTPAYDAGKYVYVTFQVADGYKFTPSMIQVPVQPVGDGEHKAVELRLTDTNSHSLVSGSATKCEGTSKGKKTTVTLAGNGTYFKGTVTLKIYVYPHNDATAAENNCYRLGTPITIEGEVEEACATMPDYESMSYTTLDYTIGDTPGAISIVGGENIDTYLWKSNTTNDRSGGSAASGTNNDVSYTPDISVAGTTYYWCEMTNTECGITIKSSAVAVTVSASKTNPTVTWDPKAKLNDSDTTAYYGGKDYTIKATLNSGWNGTLTADMMTAPAGIRLHDFTIDNSSNPKTIQATFDVQTGFDVDENDGIAFTLSLPETATYNALNSQKKVAYNVCSGGGSADEYLMPVDAAHIDNDTWKGAWVYEGTGMMCYGHGSSSISAGTKDANIKTLAHSMAGGSVTKYYKSSANHFGFYTEKAITGVRMYVYTSNTKSTVSGVYISNSASSSSTPSTGAISYEAEYYNDDDGLLAATNDGCTWVEITFASEVAAGKYGQINVSSNVNIAGIALISGSGAGASLTTTLGFASASVSKTQSDANFTNLATTSGENANTLGAITYSSSNTSCATVNATTGEVDITATGSSELNTTITATLAASGCFKGATATYTLTVAGQSCDINAGTLAITSGEATKCASDDVTLSLSGHTTDGTTATWYRGETNVTASVSENTLTTSEAGTYSVVVSDGGSCTVRSNTVTISNKSAEASVSKLVDQWYIKQGRLTPDVALFDVADATSWTVKKGKAATAIYTSDGTTTTTGLAGVGFKQVDNIVYLEGTAPTGIDAAANDTIIITVTDACGNSATSDSIVIHKQIATDKHVLAFVVTGTEKGGFTAGLTAEQTTELQLYKTLTENFDVVATNIYSTDDEQKLKEYYSQFDILCITDYPNTKTKGVNSKSYVDAIGSLIDIRPILTMEAWVSGLTNWKSKGISGTPHSPSTRQYSMLLQCKDHEIFAGTLLTKIGEGDETMYRVTMVDQTVEEYPTLDGYTPGSKDYNAGGKPALQGFEYTSAMSDLLPIGRIDDGAGNDLQVGIERQHEMEARLLVLGINSYAMERLKVDGEKVVVNALKYLMKKNAEDISDCSVYFDDASGDGKWNNPENWGPSYESLPLSTQEVRIYKPCIVDTVVRAASVKIIPNGKYSHGAATANGKLTIAPTGALIVDGKIYAATAPNFFEKRTTEPENLVVEANSTKTGTLIFDNEDGETQATIEMYSPSHWEIDPGTGKYVKYWSYVGMPIKDVHIPDYFYGAFTYYFNEAKGWEKRFDNDIMQPFEGIGLSMQEGHKETFYGTMVSTENTDITITNHTGYGDGDNLIGNSWTAPIQIANFDEDDFGTCWATVYIFNTGKGGDTYVNATIDNDGAAKAGQWLGVPIGVAGLPEYTGLKVIPAMNAFLVHDTVSTGTTLHLDYNKLVREGADTISQINQPMRAPKQARPKKKDVDGLLRIRVVGETTNTDVWMLQDERFSERYDNGWEAYFSGGDNRSPVLYAQSAVGPMGIVALQDLDGTVLGFAPSRDGNDYTFTFYYRGDEEYYLNDLKLQQSVLIDGENNYNFTFEKGDTNRFYVSRTPFEAPQITTDVDNTSSSANQSTKAIKVIYNDKLYIIRGGRVYSAEGTLVK